MSLWTEALENCIMLDRQTVNDGLGGYETRWVEGATFEAAFAYSDSIEAMAAQAAGATELYSVTTRRAVNLQYHDVFKRVRDGKVFRVKTDGDDNRTPASAGLNMREVRAEEWVLPND